MGRLTVDWNLTALIIDWNELTVFSNIQVECTLSLYVSSSGSDYENVVTGRGPNVTKTTGEINTALQKKNAISQVKRHVEKDDDVHRYPCIICLFLGHHQLMVKKNFATGLTRRLRALDSTVTPYKAIERLTARECSECMYMDMYK